MNNSQNRNITQLTDCLRVLQIMAGCTAADWIHWIGGIRAIRIAKTAVAQQNLGMIGNHDEHESENY